MEPTSNLMQTPSKTPQHNSHTAHSVNFHMGAKRLANARNAQSTNPHIEHMLPHASTGNPLTQLSTLGTSPSKNHEQAHAVIFHIEAGP